MIETEFEPARTVEADALSRLGMDIGGQRVQNAFAVAVPERLRSTPQRHLYEQDRRLEAALAGVAHRRYVRPHARPGPRPNLRTP